MVHAGRYCSHDRGTDYMGGIICQKLADCAHMMCESYSPHLLLKINNCK